MKRAIIRIPPPHKQQRVIENCKKKRILINAGRRAGKTFMVVRIALRMASRGKRVLYIAPTRVQTDAFWEKLTEWLGPAISAGLVKKYEQKRVIEFIASGGRIEARTGHKPDHLRGGWGDYIILDEYAYQNPVIYERVVLPMTLDTDGTIVFISTPDLRNHFYLTYLKALENPSWKVFTFTSLDNPFLSERALEEMTKDMTDQDYRQEILAEFLPGIGQVFILDKNDFYSRENASKRAEACVKAGHRIVAGLDWGRKNDFTSLSIGCADCQIEHSLDRWNKIEYHYQREFIANILQKRYNEIEILAEENSMGLPNIEELRRDLDKIPGLEAIIEPFTTTNSSKGTIVQAGRLAFTNHDWKWVDDLIAWNELEAYKMDISPQGLTRYSAPEGLNDDTVISRLLMIHQATTGNLQFY